MSSNPREDLETLVDLQNFNLAFLLASTEKDPVLRTNLLDSIEASRKRRATGKAVMFLATGFHYEHALVIQPIMTRFPERVIKPPVMKDEFISAINAGVTAAWKLVNHHQPSVINIPQPELHFYLPIEIPDSWSLTGRSIGLAVGIIAFGEFSGLNLTCSVVATGCLDDTGIVSTCEGLDTKFKAVAREFPDDSDLLVISVADEACVSYGCDVKSVSNLQEAVVLAYGEKARTAGLQTGFQTGEEQVNALKKLVEEKRNEDVFNSAIILLNQQGFAPAWRAWFHWFAANTALHLGMSDAEKRYQNLLIEVKQLVNEGFWHQNNLQLITKEMAIARLDQFEVDAVISELESFLAPGSPTVYLPIRIHAQGVLALAYSIAWRFTDAVNIRQNNVFLQSSPSASKEMRDTLARTYCNLAWERFLSGDLPRARDEMKRSESAIDKGNTEKRQLIWNAYTSARIELFSGNPAEALSIASTEYEHQGKYPSCMFSMLRGVALFELGCVDEAIKTLSALRLSFQGAKPGLIPWLSNLGVGWEIEALAQSGRLEEACSLAKDAIDVYYHSSPSCLFPQASTYYSKHLPKNGDSPSSVAYKLRCLYMKSWY